MSNLFTFSGAPTTESFDALFDYICEKLLQADELDTGHWQGKENNTATRELHNVTLEIPIMPTSGIWAQFVSPNLPWAEEHFQERVSGVPYNPPPSHVRWPFAQAGNADHVDETGKFAHTYPERMWPPPTLRGIRYQYGDLDGVVSLLAKYPTTRQAYVPMFYPEDITAALQGERVPCSLGWSFSMRRNKLHCFYPMRSNDWLRYGRDDLYLAGRLTQWMIEESRKIAGENSVWHDVVPGMLTCFMVSLHCFEQDIAGMKYRLKKAGR